MGGWPSQTFSFLIKDIQQIFQFPGKGPFYTAKLSNGNSLDIKHIFQFSTTWALLRRLDVIDAVTVVNIWNMEVQILDK